MTLQDTIRRILREEVAEYARTLKNARRQGSGLRFPKSAIKANPNRFRPYSREQVDESLHKVKHFYGFLGLPNYWVDDNDKSYSEKYFNDKEYEDKIFDNFFDMDKEFGHKNSLFGTRGLEPGNQNRTSKSFNEYVERFGPMIVRILKKENIQESTKKITCKCGWSWNLKDGGNDPYTCHKCGHNNSKKYIKEEKEELLNESIKEKLANLLDKEGLAETLNILKIDIDKLSSMMGISMEELMQKHNPFKNIFSDKEFEEELNESIKFLTKKHFMDHLRNESLDGILSFLIHNVIDSFHHKLIDFDTEDWIIPETPKLIKMIYGDRIKNLPNYNKWLRFIRNK